MREAMIIVPETDNAGQMLHNVIDSVVSKLVATFGGATMVTAIGAWDSGHGVYHERVRQLIIAMAPSAENDRKLREIAIQFGQLARQFSVYVRYASGDVEIIPTSVAAKAA